MPEGPTISNSSCLIALEAVGHLDILRQLYGVIEVPTAVVQECHGGLPAWIQVQPLQDQRLAQSLALGLGTGEAEAIALSMERAPARVILDDKKARRVARQLNLPVTGTLAILLRAKERSIIPDVRPVVEALMAANFRVSDVLIHELLRQAGK